MARLTAALLIFSALSCEDRTLRLPVAQVAKPVEAPAKGAKIVILKVNAHGEMEIEGRDKPLPASEFKKHVQKLAQDIRKANPGKEDEAIMNTRIVIRADEKADYEGVYNLLTICKEAGFGTLQLRARAKDNPKEE